MEDIREFERETQLLLQRKMGLDGEDEDEDGKREILLFVCINCISSEIFFGLIYVVCFVCLQQMQVI